MREILFTTDSPVKLHNLWKQFIYDPPEGYCYRDLRGEKITRETGYEISHPGNGREKDYGPGSFGESRTMGERILEASLRRSILLNLKAKDIDGRLVGKRIGRHSPDIAYSINGRLIKSDRPWVVDVENAGVFSVGYNYRALRSSKYREFIEKRLSSDSCKKILPYSETSMRSVLANLDCDSFIEKIEVVPNAVSYRKSIDRIPHETFNMLFTGSGQNLDEFYNRGGNDVVNCFLELREEIPDMRLILRCVLPEDIRKKLESTGNVEIHERPLAGNGFKELFLKSDVYLFPSFGDYALSIIEAMNYGLPVITRDFLEDSTMVRNGHNGFRIAPGSSLPPLYLPHIPIHFSETMKPVPDRKFIAGMCDKIRYLYDNDSERERMGDNGRKIVKERFSVASKKRKLKKIFDRI